MKKISSNDMIPLFKREMKKIQSAIMWFDEFFWDDSKIHKKYQNELQRSEASDNFVGK